jgi:large subunit ribosomal protein L9
MKVILLKRVPHLGLEGEVKEVAQGYARNFLFPQNVAVQASSSALRAMEEREKAQGERGLRDLRVAEALATRLGGHEVTLKKKANEQGTLFGAVTADEVSQALRKEGFKLEPSCLRFSKPVKETGAHTVHATLPHGLEAEFPLTVEPA